MIVLHQSTFTADCTELSLNDASHPGEQNERELTDTMFDVIITVSLVDRKGQRTFSGEPTLSGTMTGDAVCW